MGEGHTGLPHESSSISQQARLAWSLRAQTHVTLHACYSLLMLTNLMQVFVQDEYQGWKHSNLGNNKASHLRAFTFTGAAVGHVKSAPLCPHTF